VPSEPPQSPADALRSLADLKERGLLTDDEYEAKRKAIVDRL
jgi:putative oligomerization/nucleic acid binding protein